MSTRLRHVDERCQEERVAADVDQLQANFAAEAIYRAVEGRAPDAAGPCELGTVVVHHLLVLLHLRGTASFGQGCDLRVGKAGLLDCLQMDEVREIIAPVAPGGYEDGENTQPFRDTQIETKMLAQQVDALGHLR